MSVVSPKWKRQRGGILHRKPFCEHSAKDAKYLARSANIDSKVFAISSAWPVTERKHKWISYSDWRIRWRARGHGMTQNQFKLNIAVF
jgi:hypothetical protein